MRATELLRPRNIVVILSWGVLGLWLAPALPAAEQPPTVEIQLRDRLRATLLQLRAAETDRAALQAAQAQWADEKQKLTDRTLALTKQVNENKQTAQVVDGLKSQLARQDKQIAQLKEALQTSTQAAELARHQAAEQAKRAEQVVIGLERLVVDRQEKNLVLYQTGMEILQRYAKFGLGDALAAREPFVGITRVKLQNQVQDYQDKLQSSRATLSEKDVAAFRDKRLVASPPGGPTQTAK